MLIRFISVLAITVAFCFSPGANASTPISISGSLVHGGGLASTPLGRVPITLYLLSDGPPLTISSTISDARGHFSLVSTPSLLRKVSVPSGVYYIRAALSEGVQLSALIGSSPPGSPIVVNELSTVAASYALAQFSRSGVITGKAFQLELASGMCSNLSELSSGLASSILMNPPNAGQTISLRMLNSLSNLLAAIVNERGLASEFFSLTPNEQGVSPTSTTQALSNLARNPGENIDSIYRLSLLSGLYLEPLMTAPDAWTLTVKVNNSGDTNRLIAGPGNIVFDRNGYAWLTNNVVQGTTGSSDFLVLLKPNGKPSDGTAGYNASPISGGGILGQGFGITIDQNGTVWSGNFGWGGVNPTLAAPGSGSISSLSPAGFPNSLPGGFYSGTYRAQSLDTDSAGNLWIASYGNSSICVFLGGNPNQSQCFAEQMNSNPFGLKVAQDGSVWISNTGYSLGQNPVPSSVAKFLLKGGVITKVFEIQIGQALKGLSLDSRGNAWVASGGDNKVYAISPDGTVIGAFDGGGMSGPWSTSIDGEDNVWVANFGPLEGDFPQGRLTKLRGGSEGGGNVGEPLSPSTGYTLSSGGDPVLLANGEPLYGTGDCFCPLMRLTAAGIDQAGNIWALNNWKPSFAVDLLANPGGDGIVIFVGLASPPEPRFH
jgi:hypothetical protein